MSYTILFHPLSEEEYLKSYQWYETQQPGLGYRFEVEVESLLLKIANDPELYGFSRKSYREAEIGGFPFTIVYKINR